MTTFRMIAATIKALLTMQPPPEFPVFDDDVQRRAVCLTLARRSVGPGASVYDLIAAAGYLDQGMPAEDEGDDPDEGDDDAEEITSYTDSTPIRREPTRTASAPYVAGPYVPTDLR